MRCNLLLLAAFLAGSGVSLPGRIVAQSFTVSFPAARAASPTQSRQLLDGRLLLLLSNDPQVEPRMAIDDTPRSQQVFGVTVDGWKP